MEGLPVTISDSLGRMRLDVEAGLSSRPRTLPCVYLYDEAGCALYERITDLPSYYLTRTEAAMLSQLAPEILDRVGEREIAELGAGSATKTRILLSEADRRGWNLVYRPLDASSAMLDLAADLTQAFPRLSVAPIQGEYVEALAKLPPAERFLLFLGSTIGNLSDPEIRQLARAVTQSLAPGGFFLLGFDLRIHPGKPARILEEAYDDPEGVTAAFDLNVLARINRELGADFDLEAFVHEARYHVAEHRIEMWLRSTRRQTVAIPALGRTFEFEAGEGILTEISRRFDASDLATRFSPLRPVADWTDANRWYGLLLLQRPA